MSGVDDGTIGDDWALLRRVHPDQIVADRKTGSTRVSSAAFRDPEMSVDVEELLRRQGRDWQFSVSSHPGYSLVKLVASLARSLGQAVIHSPIAGNDAHAIVKGDKPRSVAKALSEAAVWVHRV
jgi:hypothetical protein